MSDLKTVRLPLTKGKFALIDREDLKKVSDHKWSLQGSADGWLYAAANGAGHLYLHRVILGAKKNERVTFRTRSRVDLDCRKENLVKKVVVNSNRKLYKRKKHKIDSYVKIETADGPKFKVPLTRGLYAVIDPIDVELVSKYAWSAYRHGDSYCAATKVTCRNGKTRQRLIRMHNLIASPSKGQRIDHRDHDSLYNTRKNLRRCSNNQNQQNRRKLKNGSSRYKGVSFKRGAWEASIRFNKKYQYLGRFEKEVQAAKVYDEAAKKYHGNFACLNFQKESFR